MSLMGYLYGLKIDFEGKLPSYFNSKVVSSTPGGYV